MRAVKNLVPKFVGAKDAAAAAAATSVLLIIGFGLALFLRVIIGGSGVAYSALAGLVFAAMLMVLALGGGLRTTFSWRSSAIGLGGAALLLLVPLLAKIAAARSVLPAGNYLTWALTISVVALAEEAFLRGTLFQTVKNWQGETVAVIVTAILFALLHVPLYGWHVLPLDLAVGLWLGMLRVVSGSWLAPGITHAVADLLSWWLL